MREYPRLPMNSYICALLFNGICRVSVPVFFMISGALLLEQPIDLRKNVKKTVSMFVKTVVWTIVYIVWDYFYLGMGYEMKMMFAVPVRTHFWFMYVMVGIYLTIPLWQKLVRGESKALMLYFSIAFISIWGITFILDRLKMHVTYDVPLLGNSCYAGYFIMGYVIRHNIDDIKIKKWVCVGVLVVCVAATDLLTLHYTIKEKIHNEEFSEFRSFIIGIAAMTLFYLAMKMKEPKHRPWMSFIAKHSFNVYMMHVFFLDIIQENIDISKVNAWYGTPVFLVFLLTLSLALSWLYEKAKGKRQTLI